MHFYAKFSFVLRCSQSTPSFLSPPLCDTGITLGNVGLTCKVLSQLSSQWFNFSNCQWGVTLGADNHIKCVLEPRQHYLHNHQKSLGHKFLQWYSWVDTDMQFIVIFHWLAIFMARTVLFTFILFYVILRTDWRPTSVPGRAFLEELQTAIFPVLDRRMVTMDHP